MVAFSKLNGFVEHIAEGVHNFQTDQIAVALSNVAPGDEATPPSSSTAACILANVTEIDYTNLSSRNITTSSSAQTNGVYALVLNDLVLNATGTVGPFRYVYLYNDTPTSPADPLIGYYDYGSGLTLANGESLTVDFGANLFTLSYSGNIAENFVEPDFLAATGGVFEPTVAPGAVTVAPNFLADATTVYQPTVSGAAAPVNTVAPAVTGTGYVDQTLTTTNGTWTGSPTSYTYQWQRNTGSWGNISGATSSTYVVTITDEGVPVRCVVTATNGTGSTAANSNSIEQWVPTDLSSKIVAWFDALDASTLTLASGSYAAGGPVSAWASKVGSFSVSQGTGSAQPALTPSLINGKHGLEGDFGDRLSGSLSNSGDKSSCYMVGLFRASGGNFDRCVSFHAGGSDFNNNLYWNVNLGNTRLLRVERNGNQNVSQDVGTDPGLWDAVFDGADVYTRLNGVESTKNAKTGNFGYTQITLFAQSLGGDGSRNKHGEFIICHTNLTTGEQEKLDGYRAHRWGLTSVLGSGHPYKSTAPTP